MIGEDEIQTAITEINLPTAAANSVAASFGKEESRALQDDMVRGAGVDVEAFYDLAVSVVDSASDRDDPKTYAEGYMQGFLTGVKAARAEADGG